MPLQAVNTATRPFGFGMAPAILRGVPPWREPCGNQPELNNIFESLRNWPG